MSNPNVWVPIAVALITGLLSAPLTLWFTRQARHVSLVTAQAQTIETYWRRIEECETEKSGLRAKIHESEERITRLEAQIYRLYHRLETYEKGEMQ